MYLLISTRQRGFSMVELLAVIGIILLLSALALPAVRGRMENLYLTGAAEVALGELAQARQTAMTRNLPVEVRFHLIPESNGPAYRTVSVLIPREVSGADRDEWITAGRAFPGDVVVASTALGSAPEHSTLLSAATPKSAVNPAPWAASEANSGAPSKLLGKEYFGFQFRPDGSTNLPSDQPWCVTLKNRAAPGLGTAPAANFVTLVLDPLTGRPLLHQP